VTFFLHLATGKIERPTKALDAKQTNRRFPIEITGWGAAGRKIANAHPFEKILMYNLRAIHWNNLLFGSGLEPTFNPA